MNLRSAAASPAISIVTATRNRTDLLARALRTIERQTQVDFESIVVDDGSSAEVLSHHEQLFGELGERFRLIAPLAPGVRGTGPAATRNRGAATAQGEFLAFLDDDDQWPLETYLSTAVTALRQFNGDYFFGHVDGIRDGRLLDPGWVPPRDRLTRDRWLIRDPDVHELSPESVALVARRFMIHPSGSVIRRSVFERVGGFFERLWSYAEDLNLMFRILDRSRRVLYTPQTVALYRLPTGDAISLQHSEEVQNLQHLLASQHARLACREKAIRDCARAREAWTYRFMTEHALTSGRTSDARVYARKALATYPTLGAASFALKTTTRTLFRTDADPAA